MRIACWVPEATNTLSEYVILTAFPQKQLLHERASTHLTSSSCTAVLFRIIRPIIHEFFFYLVLEESSVIAQKTHIRRDSKRHKRCSDQR